ncbi:sigma-70 family RNA polymerase sigma factor [Dongia sp.]|uniref:sigma-70 family RNA polymerase sigma factor n=1 Tax=Dongia sp. TaxID=1977262 RepID=UPI0035B0B146
MTITTSEAIRHPASQRKLVPELPTKASVENRMDSERMDAQVPKNTRADVERMLLDVIPHLRAFARSLTRNRDQADDLTHDAVVRALAAIDQFTPGTNFKAWMFTILRNLYYNECRKRWIKSTPIDDLAGDEPSVGPSQEANLEFSDFRRAFWHLNADQREVLILVGASGFSYEEAAEVCNCRVGTVKSRVSRARAELKQLLEQGALPGQRSDPLPAQPDGLDEFLEQPSGMLPTSGK